MYQSFNVFEEKRRPPLSKGKEKVRYLVPTRRIIQNQSFQTMPEECNEEGAIGTISGAGAVEVIQTSNMLSR